MNDDQLDDLKQFIDSRISQSETRFDEKIGELKVDINQRFDEVQTAIAETITVSNDSADDQLKVHEQRITKLEQQAA